ncbi:Hypothetical predicted protein [Mytilus galloprovincialis]|uniref:Uncharacterized protein n=1 Tax=Mytilus galloprovincialis TaxID=29158 RepID=A0A8B6GH24_MYTGA|nr:Hypothetical predicted protein [Mytilus galloprovincialis]
MNWKLLGIAILCCLLNGLSTQKIFSRARRQMSERWLDHYRTLVALHALNATDYRVCGNIIGCGLVDIEKSGKRKRSYPAVDQPLFERSQTIKDLHKRGGNRMKTDIYQDLFSVIRKNRNIFQTIPNARVNSEQNKWSFLDRLTATNIPQVYRNSHSGYNQLVRRSLDNNIPKVAGGRFNEEISNINDLSDKKVRLTLMALLLSKPNL